LIKIKIYSNNFQFLPSKLVEFPCRYWCQNTSVVRTEDVLQQERQIFSPTLTKALDSQQVALQGCSFGTHQQVKRVPYACV